MGGVGETLFGSGPKPEKSESGNHAWKPIKEAFTPALGYVTGSGNMMSNLLGIGGGPAQTAALENFANSGGMQFLREQGNNQINSNQAAKGLLKSGSTLQELTKYGQGLGSTYLNQYMQNLLGLGNLGLGAGGVMAQAGQWSKGTGASQGKQGIIPMALNAAAVMGASDIQLKENLQFAGKDDNGVRYYYFNYKKDTGLPEGRFYGVIAQELKKIDPASVVTMKNGYLGVKAPYIPKRID